MFFRKKSLLPKLMLLTSQQRCKQVQSPQNTCFLQFFVVIVYFLFVYPILPYPILPYPTLSYPTLSYPILSYPILSYPILSSKFYIAPTWAVQSPEPGPQLPGPGSVVLTGLSSSPDSRPHWIVVLTG